ncbi:MAG: hypothetical protein NTY96_02435 [Bacteroidetes bacterium]|nr:hypothetical protein [Bacteroidota bacterium]
MRKAAIILTILISTLFASYLTHAQDSANIFHPTKPALPKDNFWRRLSVGGNVGFQFGTVTGIMLSPEVRVRTFDQLYVGLGFTYEYFRYRDYYWDDLNKNYLDFSSNVYGGRVFLRYYLRSIFHSWIGNLFAHAEYEYLAYIQPFHSDPYNGYIYDPYNNRLSPGQSTVSYNSVLIGAGYSQPIGGRVFMDILILFNLNDAYYSPYSNPVFRIGVGVGL